MFKSCLSVVLALPCVDLFFCRVFTDFSDHVLKGFTFFEQVQGRGSVDGEPRRGTHTWPEMNSAVMTVVPDEKVDELLLTVRKLDARNKSVGVRAFVWNIEQAV